MNNMAQNNVQGSRRELAKQRIADIKINLEGATAHYCDQLRESEMVTLHRITRELQSVVIRLRGGK